jgi:flagellar assembly protein FliH
MSIRDGRTEERTPAPAGRISRILAYGEAKDIGIAPWLLEDLDGDAKSALATVYAAQEAKTESRELELRLAQAEQQMRQEAQEAAERARREAEARFSSKLQSEVEPWLRRLAASIEDIATVRQRYVAESEEKVVRLAIAIARRILHREMQVDPLALQGLLHAAIEQSGQREMQRILLNPQDLEALGPHLAKLNLPPRVEVSAERSLERGALLIESSSGTLDASVDSQLDEVERGFIDMLGKRGTV